MSVRGIVSPPTNRHDTEGPPDVWVHRFGRTERFVHWWTVLMLGVAVLSGLGMGDDGGSSPILMVHVGAVVLIGVGITGALLFGQHRALFTQHTTRLARHGVRPGAPNLGREAPPCLA